MTDERFPWRPTMNNFLFLIVVLTASGCASHGPVLYPNEHLKIVGKDQARKDIADCDRLAAEYVKSEAGKTVAKNTAVGGAAGTVVGGAAGAAAGNLGKGASVGAAAGAAAGLVRGVSKASEPSPIHKRFVEKCLRDRGYEPLGWE
ncbi:MAG: cell envelope biogenesis protein OmpA [Syntrophales bacterium]